LIAAILSVLAFNDKINSIKTLKELGKNKTEIARITRYDSKTVDKVIKQIENGKKDRQ